MGSWLSHSLLSLGSDHSSHSVILIHSVQQKEWEVRGDSAEKRMDEKDKRGVKMVKRGLIDEGDLI